MELIVRVLSLIALAGCGGGPDPAAPGDGGADAAAGDAGEADGGAADAGRPDATTCDTEGCVPCTPGVRRCDGTVSMVCATDGSRWLHGRDCADWGVECDDSGYCQDDCAEAEATRSYVGCEYYAAPFANSPELDRRVFDFRVVVANPSSLPADVTVYAGPHIEARHTVVPGDLVVISLPWVDRLSFELGPDPWTSTVVPDGAYRIVASRPVIVSQFNPFEYGEDWDYSYSNDASLLLPVHALGTEHLAASYVPIGTGGETFPGYPGWIGVVGVSPEPTTVEVVAAGEIEADAEGRWDRTPEGGTFSFTLARGEVAQIANAVQPECGPERPGYTGGDHPLCREHGHDVTGSVVRSDRPVAVFSGHACAFVPYDIGMCDHLETQLAPVTTWGRKLATAPMRDPGVNVPNLLRVIAARDDTTVTFDPPVDGRERVLLDAGEHVEVSVAAPVAIEADAPIQVAQYLMGQFAADPPSDRGDPALTILVPAEQFRPDYVFVTPTSYSDNPFGQSYVLVSRRPDVPIELDGEQLEATWASAGDQELAVVPVGGGTHRARSAAPFGLVAFGLGSYTSFAYPAGLNLRNLIE